MAAMRLLAGLPLGNPRHCRPQGKSTRATAHTCMAALVADSKLNNPLRATSLQLGQVSKLPWPAVRQLLHWTTAHISLMCTLLNAGRVERSRLPDCNCCFTFRELWHGEVQHVCTRLNSSSRLRSSWGSHPRLLQSHTASARSLPLESEAQHRVLEESMDPWLANAAALLLGDQHELTVTVWARVHEWDAGGALHRAAKLQAHIASWKCQ